MRLWLCESCGAPLEAPWAELVIVCQFCGAHNLPGSPDGPVPPRVPVDGRPRLNVGGRTYVIEGRLAEGESSTVYRARWVVRLGELVTLKVLSALTDADLMRREWQVLTDLHRSTIQGAEHYLTRLPSPVAHGLVETDQPRPVSVFGWKSGFVHTLEDITRVHDDGVPTPVMVWLLKRLLELLGWVHRAGYVHGAVTPEHVLVHPRDHGAMLVGWSLALPWREGQRARVLAVPRRWPGLYPHRWASPARDIANACTIVRTAAGWDRPGDHRDAPLEALLQQGMNEGFDDAWQAREALVKASAEVLGPPAYHPLPMPGWS